MTPADGHHEHGHDHDAEESRQILQELRDKQVQLFNDSSSTLDGINDVVAGLNQNIPRYDRQSEIEADASTISLATRVTRKRLQHNKIGSSSVLDFDKFTQRLLTFFQRQDDTRQAVCRWGKQSRMQNLRVPTIGSMIGPIGVDKRRVVRRRAERLVVDKSKQKRPDRVEADDMQQGSNQQTELIKGILRFIEHYEQQDEGSEGIPLYQFIVNPQHFSQTVENLFYLSFLVRDGKVGVSLEDGEPLIYTVKRAGAPEGPASSGAASTRNNQIAVDIDMESAEKLAELYGLSEPMIPTRIFDEHGTITNMHEFVL